MQKILEKVITDSQSKEYQSNIEFCKMNGGVDITDTRKARDSKPYLREKCTSLGNDKYKIEIFKL